MEITKVIILFIKLFTQLPEAYFATVGNTSQPLYDINHISSFDYDSNFVLVTDKSFSYIDDSVTSIIVFDITIYLTYWYTGKNSNLKREDLHMEDQRISFKEENSNYVDIKQLLDKNYVEGLSQKIAKSNTSSGKFGDNINISDASLFSQGLEENQFALSDLRQSHI